MSSRAEHGIGKTPRSAIQLLEGLGVEGDAHLGQTVQHRSRVKREPTQPNLRQVHLAPEERLRELSLEPGRMGENVTTSGVDLHGLPSGARLRLGPTAVVIELPAGEPQRLEPV